MPYITIADRIRTVANILLFVACMPMLVMWVVLFPLSIPIYILTGWHPFFLMEKALDRA